MSYYVKDSGCKIFLALGHCPATRVGIAFPSDYQQFQKRGRRQRLHYASPDLHPIDWLHRWNVADAVLDGGDSGLPAPAQL